MRGTLRPMSDGRLSMQQVLARFDQAIGLESKVTVEFDSLDLYCCFGDLSLRSG